jgi:hypothetical protein
MLYLKYADQVQGDRSEYPKNATDTARSVNKPLDPVLEMHRIENEPVQLVLSC